MDTKILFLILLFSLIGITFIILNKFRILKKLKEEAKKERLKQEKKIFEEHEEKTKFNKKDKKKQEEKKTFSILELKQKIKKADMLISFGEINDAKKILIGILSYDENFFDANFLLGKIFLDEKNFSKAEFFLLKALKGNEKNIDLLGKIGYCNLQNGKYKEAIEVYEYAVSLCGGRFDFFKQLGKLYFLISDFKKSLECFKEALKIKPKDTEIFFMKAEIFIEEKNFSEAKKIYKKILQIEPYNQEAHDYLENLEHKGL
ncbi:hypothetical protein LR002_02170 [Candidatus Gracilibacteria bacterium]|nr:hypothetical protein [Candidatus Gracilibacteria bacterium]